MTDLRGPAAVWEDGELPESFVLLQRASTVKDMLRASHGVSIERLSQTAITEDDLVEELRGLISISAMRGHIGTTAAATDLLLEILTERGL
tara:strand:+ start:608 stop:880 length:273 start_codon:yes stop_codon:yes gene_type:complete